MKTRQELKEIFVPRAMTIEYYKAVDFPKALDYCCIQMFIFGDKFTIEEQTCIKESWLFLKNNGFYP